MFALSWTRRALVSAALFAALGCGSKPKTAVNSSNPASGKAETAKASGDGNQAIPKGERVPSPKLLDRRARTAVATDTLGLVKSAAPPPKSDAEVYRSVAPATVIVRVPGGLGSGVIIDPAGWVLTNHHVIAHGETQDFQTKVTVMLGTMSKKSGGMVRQKKTYDAYVYKDDSLRDLALLEDLRPAEDAALRAHRCQEPDPRSARDRHRSCRRWHAVGHQERRDFRFGQAQ